MYTCIHIDKTICRIFVFSNHDVMLLTPPLQLKLIAASYVVRMVISTVCSIMLWLLLFLVHYNVGLVNAQDNNDTCLDLTDIVMMCTNVCQGCLSSNVTQSLCISPTTCDCSATTTVIVTVNASAVKESSSSLSNAIVMTSMGYNGAVTHTIVKTTCPYVPVSSSVEESSAIQTREVIAYSVFFATLVVSVGVGMVICCACSLRMRKRKNMFTPGMIALYLFLYYMQGLIA